MESTEAMAPAVIPIAALPANAVPCNGCTACCHGDAIRLLPGDVAESYRTAPHDRVPGALMLEHQPNGDCVYLGPIGLGRRGCTIHWRKPLMCREFDCRTVAQGVSRVQALKLVSRGLLSWSVLRQGYRLLKRHGPSQARALPGWTEPPAIEDEAP